MWQSATYASITARMPLRISDPRVRMRCTGPPPAPARARKYRGSANDDGPTSYSPCRNSMSSPNSSDISRESAVHPAIASVQLPICLAANSRMNSAAVGPMNPIWRNPMLKTCGTGPTRSTASLGTMARTESVPSTNIKAIMGVAIITERAMLRAGFLHSPARMATYSKPLNAPMDILPNTFKLNRDHVGAAIVSGW